MLDVFCQQTLLICFPELENLFSTLNPSDDEEVKNEKVRDVKIEDEPEVRVIVCDMSFCPKWVKSLDIGWCHEVWVMNQAGVAFLSIFSKIIKLEILYQIGLRNISKPILHYSS